MAPRHLVLLVVLVSLSVAPQRREVSKCVDTPPQGVGGGLGCVHFFVEPLQEKRALAGQEGRPETRIGKFVAHKQKTGTAITLLKAVATPSAE